MSGEKSRGGLVLASKSPRRRELLALITANFTLDEADVDESAVAAADPAALALALARAKAGDVARRRAGDRVIGCDTVVACGGTALGKPRDAAEVLSMLRQLSGSRHRVHTGVCLRGPGVDEAFVETTAVDFSPLPETDMRAYAATDEPYDKAGAYGIQGWAAKYIPRIEGCYYNVMGLPVSAVHAALTQAGWL